MKQIGAVTVDSDIIEVDLTLDTSAYADGDLLADAQEVPNFFGENGVGTITSIMVVDTDDQGIAFDLFFTDDSTSWGTENSAVAIADAQADDIQVVVSVATSDFVDLVNSQVAFKGNVNAIVKTSGAGNLYVAAVSRGAGTYTASGLKLRIGVIRD